MDPVYVFSRALARRHVAAGIFQRGNDMATNTLAPATASQWLSAIEAEVGGVLEVYSRKGGADAEVERALQALIARVAEAKHELPLGDAAARALERLAEENAALRARLAVTARVTRDSTRRVHELADERERAERGRVEAAAFARAEGFREAYADADRRYEAAAAAVPDDALVHPRAFVEAARLLKAKPAAQPAQRYWGVKAS